MSAPPSPESIAANLLASQGLRLQSIKTRQSLWAGYGQICQISASATSPDSDSSTQTSASASNSNSGVSTPQEAQSQPDLQPHSLILKLITPPRTSPAHDITPTDEGHIRKILSYRIEQYFYTHLAPHLPPSIPVATCLASINEQHANGTSTTAMLMTDLRQRFPVAGEKRGALSPTQVNAAIDWLASFHGFWWPRVGQFDRRGLVRPPLEEMERELRGEHQDAAQRTVWLNGGYTYLATRRTEFSSLAASPGSEWSPPLTDWEEGDVSLAEMVAGVLAPRAEGWGPSEAYQTLIHGDVKAENLFTSRDGEEVAFYDFQYTGLGLGVCDLAKLVTCSVELGQLVGEGSVERVLAMQGGERRLLRRYLQKLKDVAGKEYEWDVFVRHWETALVDWLRFQASWGFWGNTEWLEARVRSILKDDEWRQGVVGNRTYR